MAPNRADLNSEAICKARHQVVSTKTDSNVASGSTAVVSKRTLCATGHHGCHTRFSAQSGCGGEGSRSSAHRLRRPVRRQPRAQSLLIVCAIQAAIVYPRGVTAKALAPARKPIERRIYELARKHCGDSQEFRIGLPNYRVSMERDIVTFTTRKDRILDGNARFPMLMPEAFEKARRVAPSWDIYYLKGLWRDWIGGKEEPKNPDAAFIAFCCKKYH